jgi:hypothetical protein
MRRSIPEDFSGHRYHVADTEVPFRNSKTAGHLACGLFVVCGLLAEHLDQRGGNLLGTGLSMYLTGLVHPNHMMTGLVCLMA